MGTAVKSLGNQVVKLVQSKGWDFAPLPNLSLPNGHAGCAWPRQQVQVDTSGGVRGRLRVSPWTQRQLKKWSGLDEEDDAEADGPPGGETSDGGIRRPALRPARAAVPKAGASLGQGCCRERGRCSETGRSRHSSIGEYLTRRAEEEAREVATEDPWRKAQGWWRWPCGRAQQPTIGGSFKRLCIARLFRLCVGRCAGPGDRAAACTGGAQAAGWPREAEEPEQEGFWTSLQGGSAGYKRWLL